MIETEQCIRKAARAQITILSKMRMAGCIGALVFMCFATYTSQEGINDVFRCPTTSKNLKDQLNNFLIFSDCYFIPVLKTLILYLTTFLCAGFAHNKNDVIRNVKFTDGIRQKVGNDSVNERKAA